MEDLEEAEQHDVRLDVGSQRFIRIDPQPRVETDNPAEFRLHIGELAAQSESKLLKLLAILPTKRQVDSVEDKRSYRRRNRYLRLVPRQFHIHVRRGAESLGRNLQVTNRE